MFLDRRIKAMRGVFLFGTVEGRGACATHAHARVISPTITHNHGIHTLNCSHDARTRDDDDGARDGGGLAV